MSGQAYVGSSKRTFGAALEHLLEKEFKFLGPGRVREMLVDDVLKLVDEFYPPGERLRPGWVVFTGTKAVGRKAYPGQEGGDHELVTIAWPLLLSEDITTLIEAPPGVPGQQARHDLLLRRLVRLVEHGQSHKRGPVLLTQADLSLLLGLKTEQISMLLAEARRETGKPLLTKGYFFDQGMRPTHKKEVIDLYARGVDEADIAYRTQHSPQAVGRYIRDYERVKLLVERQIETADMVPLTGMTPAVIRAHYKLLQQHRPDLFAENGANTSVPT